MFSWLAVAQGGHPHQSMGWYVTLSLVCLVVSMASMLAYAIARAPIKFVNVIGVVAALVSVTVVIALVYGVFYHMYSTAL